MISYCHGQREVPFELNPPMFQSTPAVPLANADAMERGKSVPASVRHDGVTIAIGYTYF
jgi:hypothetical protein